MGNSKLTPAEVRDVRTLISILREVVGEDDVMMIAAIVTEEAELAMGSTDLPMVRQLAHELIDIAEVIVEGERKMVSHSFYDKSFGWECSWKCSVIGIILEGKRNEKRE